MRRVNSVPPASSDRLGSKARPDFKVRRVSLGLLVNSDPPGHKDKLVR